MKHVTSTLIWIILKKSQTRKLHKCFLDPNNKLSIYDYVANKGIINLIMVHKVVIRVKDVYENVSELNFKVMKSKQIFQKTLPKIPLNSLLFFLTKNIILLAMNYFP